MNIPIIIICLLLALTCPITKGAQSLHPDEYKSVQWIMNQYQQTMSLVNPSCDEINISTNNETDLICTNDTVQRIITLLNTMPGIKSLMPSANLLQMLDNPINVNIQEIQITNTDASWPDNFPVNFKLKTLYFDKVTLSGNIGQLAFNNAVSFRLTEVNYTSSFTQHIFMDPSLTYPSLVELILEYPRSPMTYTSFNLNNVHFPLLSTFDLTNYENVTITLGVKNITIFSVRTMSLDPSKTKGNPLSLVQLVGDLPNFLQLTLNGANINPTNLTNYPTLYNIRHLNYTIPLTDIKQVETLTIQNGNMKTAPPPSWLMPRSSTTSVYLMGNEIEGELPDYPVAPHTFNVGQNPGVVGTIPDSHCNIQWMDYTNTSITKVPDCFYCYWTFVGVKLTNTPIKGVPANFSCPVVLDKTHFIITDPVYNRFTITGKNLGFHQLFMNISSLLVPDIILPSTIIGLTPPEPYGNATIYFSQYNKNPITIFWARDLTVVDNIESTLFNGTLSVNITGTFQSEYNYTVLVTQQLCTIFQQTNQTLRCTVPSFTINPNVPMVYNVSSPYQSIFKPLYIQNSPVVIDTSDLTTDGGKLTLTGLFVVVQVDGSNGALSVGYVNLSVIVDKVEYHSSNQLFIDPIVLKEDCGDKANKCNGKGDCNGRGVCDCSVGFGGHYCEFTLSPDVQILPSDTSSAIQTTKSKLNFNLVEIQELDLNRRVVLPNQPFLEVSVIFQFSSQSRSLSFGGMDVNLLPNALKVTVSINHWQFLSNINSLRPVFANTITNLTDRHDSPCHANTDSTTTISDNLTKSLSYIQVTFEETVYYGRFLPVAVANGRPTNFSVLVDNKKADERCEEKSNKWLIIAIVVPIGVVTIAVAIGLTIYIKQKMYYHHENSRINSRLKNMSTNGDA
ncbi:hypothetical protein SAMD00019534_009560 [Acytostelium subglobosum LB1]|uniref:hypothetical protein n=1 Tax=Acytostelium subglobosum LB1 TaxID=1410327 RepID=UPI0006447AD6|nr:hypothetical protein SAMD00019534_009560 [Acytostelium subglobosum LB1]GAM17781.1 hypothetical protein SAMD00019534_009560 [Acytostelium subglobosum LB1]|eukprot:XP_012758377.1 hypothetical protein SAMD00019534_009560 [Acytostelium subglobosum LB1]